ncbi:electron transport protein SCO1/SenC [Magnetococcus marinus MC-1]|uniref:Electron transport protein SCO1/SenC n=1 Tax=Magnetococcus marinus (strain ATCC BAA-1437 / JCM 17883 / MC-1) TaxID=156889 RepID=A0L6J1_MAGMM|nr:SCO family protein [Magnetococcus marinus]ABK43584.1 electron transport protein SCO1/SenC [Magnetococcus marinus MC-1]
MKSVANGLKRWGIWPILGLFMGLLLVACSQPAEKKGAPQWVAVPAALKGIALQGPRPVTQFQLVDEQGQPFDQSRLLGKWSLIFFGYTYCPDVCPTSLTLLAEMFELMGAQQLAEAYQGLFISVDPQRDSVELLKEYTGYFHSAIMGVTGTPAAIAGVAGQMGALYYREPGRSDTDYLISHSAKLHVVNPAGQLVALLPSERSPEALVELLKTLKTMKIKDVKP